MELPGKLTPHSLHTYLFQLHRTSHLVAQKAEHVAQNRAFSCTLFYFQFHAHFFAAVTLRANLSFYCFQKKISPEIIRYGAFYISLKELVDSMKPVQWLSKIIIETGILHIMDNLPEGSKKVVMPVRFSVSFSKTFFHHHICSIALFS